VLALVSPSVRIGRVITSAERVLREVFGLDAFREAIDRCMDLAEHAQRRIEASSRLTAPGLMAPISRMPSRTDS